MHIDHDDLEIDLQAYSNDNQKVDTMVRSLESLVGTKDFVDQNRDQITAPMYELIEQSVESFINVASFGMTTRRVMPSNESFGQDTNLGEVTCESLGEGIKNVYLSIINAVKAAFKWMGGLLKRLFGRNKDRSEKLEKLATEATEVKEGSTTHSWASPITLKNPESIRKICTERGIMTNVEIDKIAEELKQVFSKQSDNLKKATAAANDLEVKFEWVPPFASCHDSTLMKQITRDSSEKVYVSHEFGGGQYIYVVVPAEGQDASPNERDKAKAQLKRVDQMRVGKIVSDRQIDLSSRNTLSGDQADADKIIELVISLNKMLVGHVTDLQHFQSTKERFISDFEKEIKKEGVNLFSSVEKKTKRDQMLYRLKLFKKTMDEPAMTYYGACDGLVATFAHLATTVLEMNRHPGKQTQPA